MPYIYENRSVRHDAGPDTRFQLKEFLMQEVNRAWAENDPCGGISCSWNEDYLTVSVLSSGKTIASTSYAIMREDGND